MQSGNAAKFEVIDECKLFIACATISLMFNPSLLVLNRKMLTPVFKDVYRDAGYFDIFLSLSSLH